MNHQLASIVIESILSKEFFLQSPLLASALAGLAIGILLTLFIFFGSDPNATQAATFRLMALLTPFAGATIGVLLTMFLDGGEDPSGLVMTKNVTLAAAMSLLTGYIALVVLIRINHFFRTARFGQFDALRKIADSNTRLRS